MQPKLNAGEYVFCTINNLQLVDDTKGYTIIIQKELADVLHFSYFTIFGWITLTVHSSLQAVGLTAAISSALSNNRISCNVVAAYITMIIFLCQ